MTPELIGIITVGVALAAVYLTMWNRIDKRLDRIEDRLSAQGERQARFEGVLEVYQGSLVRESEDRGIRSEEYGVPNLAQR